MSIILNGISNNLPQFGSKAKEFGGPSAAKIPVN